MKFICSQESLSKALNTVSKAVSTRTTIPILKGILLETEGSQLRLAASDLDLSIEKKIDVQVQEEGSLVVSARLFGDIIRKLPSADVEIEEMENSTVIIRCLSSEFTIVGQSSEEFPNIGEVTEEQKLTFNKELFKDMVKKTSFAASSEEAKGIIVGVLMDMMPDCLTMVALDGFRMAIVRESMKNEEEKKIVIAARILNEITKIIMDSDDEEDIALVLDSKRALVISDQTKISLRLLEGEFIKYNDILPKESKTKVTVEKSEMLSSIERASLLAKAGKNHLIKIVIEDGKLTITSRSEEGNVKEEVIADKEGDDLEIGFNSKYVLDVLKAIENEEIFMEFNSSVSPCLVKPTSGNAFEYLILPVRISGN